MTGCCIVTSLTQIFQNLWLGKTAHSPANSFLQSHLAIWGRRASHSCYGNEMKSEMEKQNKMLLREMPAQQSHWPPQDPPLPPPIPHLKLAHAGQWHTGSVARPMPGAGSCPGLGTGTFAHNQLCVTRTNSISVNKVLEKLRCCTLLHKVYSSSPLAPFNAIIALLNFSLFNVTQSVFFCYHLFN